MQHAEEMSDAVAACYAGTTWTTFDKPVSTDYLARSKSWCEGHEGAVLVGEKHVTPMFLAGRDRHFGSQSATEARQVAQRH